MKISNIIVCVALFLAGMWIGTIREPKTRVVEITKKTERVDYLDTTEHLRHRLEVIANTFDLTLSDMNAWQQHKEWHFLD